MMGLKYSPAFIRKIKRLFPKDTLLHFYLDTNSIWVGERLQQLLQGGIHPRRIMNALRRGEADRLLCEADRALRKRRRIESALAEWQKYVVVEYAPLD